MLLHIALIFSWVTQRCIASKETRFNFRMVEEFVDPRPFYMQQSGKVGIFGCIYKMRCTAPSLEIIKESYFDPATNPIPRNIFSCITFQEV
jgi:hypothetical protein